jgi:hypothetical protein
MLDFLRYVSGQRKSETFGQLTIEKRVLITPKSTISIANIAVISSGIVRIASKPVWALALALLAGGVATLTYGGTRIGFTEAAAGAAMVIGALVLARFFAKTEKPCLSISTSDGHTSLFTGQAKTLEEVRRLLSEKINADDETATYRVHFEKGLIHTVSAGHGAFLGAMGPSIGSHISAGPPSAPLGNGHYATGNAVHADYSQVLPNIVEMQRFYAQRQDTQDIADRLSELEHLMRSGTPTPGSRSRLSQLLGDLSSLLGAYPGVVQVFQQAARIAGL